METDRQGLLVLDRSACAQLLRTTRVGRLALVHGALPMILPVAFAMLDADLVFNVGPGTLSRAADHCDVVCFETDSVDAGLADMWSVSVVGQLSRVVSPADLSRAAQLDLPCWEPGEFIRLTPQIFSGRRTFAR
jgi:uncharacterized protein